MKNFNNEFPEVINKKVKDKEPGVIVDFNNLSFREAIVTARKELKKISVVVPVYNEIENIESFHKELQKILKKYGTDFEILYIDDRSSDGTEKYLKKISNKGTIKVFKKQGKQGKAYSLIEGFERTKGNILVMIDADLQYPPSAIPGMINMLEKAEVVVANRKKYYTSVFRKIFSKTFRYLFGEMLFGLNTDTQSGLKVFKREVFRTVRFKPVSPWTFDLEFLHRAKTSGFNVESYDITFSPRLHGHSKVSVIQASLEIGLNAFYVKMRKIPPLIIKPENDGSMLGAGIGFRKNKYITHTTLPFNLSAIKTFSISQTIIIFLFIDLIVLGLVRNPLFTAQIIVASLSILYFADMVFNLVIVLRSLNRPNEISFTDRELRSIRGKNLPAYTILSPLYKEARVIPGFLESIRKIEWPKEKLDVILLLESDDMETINAVEQTKLPPYVRAIVVPDSKPKTKPKACNYGLGFARGEYLVIYDAEDRPDPKQLKKAYLGFGKVDGSVICLQAKLNYYNHDQNLLTRFFTAEYSLWFDITLTGLQSLNSTIPLGGTSNHFRTEDLRKLQGWDPFNVTEDADLGVRLFLDGFKTAIIDSTTWEEANSKIINWLRQRSRWIKGYMQTYLVHMRNMQRFLTKRNLKHSFIFQITTGGKLAFILLNPLMWLLTFVYFAFYNFAGQLIQKVYVPPFSYIAVISWVFGNFLFIYYYMIGVAKRGQWDLVKYVFLVPVYWLMMSMAGGIALYQLIVKPHYWEKTVHGFSMMAAAPELSYPGMPAPRYVFLQKILPKKLLNSGIFSGGVLVLATVSAHVMNLGFNLYLGKVLNLENLGLISLISAFFFISSIPFGALYSTVNYRSGFLEGRFGDKSAYQFWKYIRKNSFLTAIAVSGIWLLLTPLLTNYFNLKGFLPLMLLIPVWLIGFAFYVDKGYFSGKLMFGSLAVVTLVEPLIKFITAFLLVKFNLAELTYLAIPLSFVLAFATGWMIIRKQSGKYPDVEISLESIKFPGKYFFVSLLSGLSTIAFMSLDIILAKHYLSDTEAGRYALISLVGKMIFFIGSLSFQFITPLVSRNEGNKADSKKTLYLILFFTLFLTLGGFLMFGILGNITLPILFGAKAGYIIPYMGLFCFSMMCFTISRVFVYYYATVKSYTASIISFFLIALQYILIFYNHVGVGSIVSAMVWTGALNLLAVLILHFNYKLVNKLENDFSGLFSFGSTSLISTVSGQKPSILIFNWRDTRHKWAGGAEVYVQELAKRWVENGSKVTIFCGNDRGCPGNEVIDGINVCRRGGTYTVYIWAFIYYIFHFRNKYDLVIDCENGIPFFTPLYINKPVFLLVHHVHQEVFRQHLAFPLAQIAMILESKLMPSVYSHKTIITVSESSKKEIIKLGFSDSQNILIIENGINSSGFSPAEKYKNPTFMYLGRLKPYKSIGIIIKAFTRTLLSYPNAQLLIAGDGESKNYLKTLTAKLSIEDNVKFLGKVSDEEKAQLLASSWAVLQPSRIEGWGITVIEANASGTPVIASRVNGLKDSVIDGRTGILVDFGNINQFSQAMNRLISDERYLNYLAKESLDWSGNFDWNDSAGTFYALIDNTLHSSEKAYASGNLVFAGLNKI